MTWLDVNDSRPGFNGFGRIDPYIDWIFGTEGGIFRNEKVAKRFPLLVRLRNRWTPAQFATGEFFTTSPPSDRAQTVSVPDVYTKPAQTFASDTYFTALVSPRFFRYFLPDSSAPHVSRDLFAAIARMMVSQDLRPETLAPKTLVRSEASLEVQQWASVPEHGTVVMGIIDEGLAIANSRFRAANGGSRIEYVWLQDADYSTAG